MSRKSDLSYFNLNSLDGRLGYEKSRSKPVSVGDSTVVTIVFVIKPFPDVIITEPVDITLQVPLEYHLTGGLRVFVPENAVKYFDNNVQKGRELVIEGMDRVRYPMTVWFYAIRLIVKRPRSFPWSSPPLLDPQFQCVDLEWVASCTELQLFCGSGRTRGKRNYMEDIDFAYEAIKIHDQRSVSVFGVLDGHGGKDCAQFCADDIPVRIAGYIREGKSSPDALFHAFLHTDKECLDSGLGGKSGSTANVSLYDRMYNVFYIANTGDTRAVLSRSGSALDLSFDRKGSDPEEIARIARAGGFVVNGRVMGSLAVSRALGDMQLKEQGNPNLKGVLVADPELSAFYPTNEDEFVVIATDGLWDVMSSQTVVDRIRILLKEEGLLDKIDLYSIGQDLVKMKLSQIANNIAVHAVSNLNSMDNVTVLIILLKNGPASMPPQIRNKISSISAKFTSNSSAQSSTATEDYSQDVHMIRNSRKSREASFVQDIDLHDEQAVETLIANANRSSSTSAIEEEEEWKQDTVIFRGGRVQGNSTSRHEEIYEKNQWKQSDDTKGANVVSRTSVHSHSVAYSDSKKLDDDVDDLLEFLQDDRNF